MPEPASAKPAWILVGLVHGSERLSTIKLSPLPFRIGRYAGLELTLPATSVSREHAEFYGEGDRLRLRDLGSTNGTFVNRKRIRDEAVSDGDIIHFGEVEFRLGLQASGGSWGTMVMEGLPQPQQLMKGTRELGELLRLGAVTVEFQPIVGLSGRDVIGYEALGRGRYPGIAESPVELFQIGASLGVESELSSLFRRKTLEIAASRDRLPMLFLNTHPSEIAEPGLLESLVDLKHQAPGQDIAIEIHEAAIVKPARIAELRAGLRDHDIGLAYDDFGAGQARLLELGEVPPDILKFDVRFVRNLDRAPGSKRRMVRSLVEIARDLGVEPLAEGVETPQEAEVCMDLGFTLAQGYHFGRPVPIDRVPGGPARP
ncbi:MAG TPA: EAL domain-containing protein [Candidatus Methylomirabilis sp.]|nr:EAL domain-containing protein [Candidatus Methylomirabilis sp.]